MSALLLKGAPVARRIRDQTAASAALLRAQTGVEPTLASVLVGHDNAAVAYRDAIARSVVGAGVRHRPIELSATVSADRFLAAISGLNDDATIHGLLLLMPLPAHIPLESAIEHLSPMKDVDGITPTNAGRLYLGLPALRPSTPQGGIELLDHYGLPVAGHRAVVIGRSNVVGKPLAALLTGRDATVTLCHRHTRDLAELVAAADLVAVAAGQPGLLHGNMLGPNAVVLDFGINVVGNVIVGDADAASVAERAAAYSPAPGGAGPVTTMVLARNTVAAAFAALGAEVEATAVSPADPIVGG
jgi:methylenetetrahydrofolate dehydrogenase (NADP+)/methenyltetrahydrofolate cyclohydrolase